VRASIPRIKPVSWVVKACARRVIPSGSMKVPMNNGGKVRLGQRLRRKIAPYEPTMKEVSSYW
jgi:hypothetical protein